MTIKRHIPNFITLLNLLCGSLAVIFALKGELTISIYLVLCASIFDFLDGFSARLLKAYSQIGKELDSLADLVSFGLAPSLLLYYQYSNLIILKDGATSFTWQLLSFLPLIVVLASGYRLAKFNIDTRQSFNFIGLPTPASALFILSFIDFSQHSTLLTPLFNHLAFIPLLSLTLSFLLVSEIPIFSFKFKEKGYKANSLKINFLLFSILIAIPIVVTKSKWSLWMLIVIFSYILYNSLIFLIKRSELANESKPSIK